VGHPICLGIDQPQSCIPFCQKQFQNAWLATRYIKTNSSFKFNDELQVDVESQSPAQYPLYGVVLHNGDLEGGHYRSVIKLNSRWVKFDDVEVSEIMQAQFEADAFGSDGGSWISAYLLFFARADQRAEVRILDQRDLHFHQEIMQ
jgi:ubiquitin C-terminal hydrolase